MFEASSPAAAPTSLDSQPELPQTKSKRYKCVACYNQYKKKEHLAEHYKVMSHSVHQPRCGVCQRHFKCFESTREHLIGATAKEMCKTAFSQLGCELCLKLFDSPTSLSEHKSTCRLSAPVAVGAWMKQSHESERKTSKGNHVGDGPQAIALDCEMVAGGEDGSLDLCARVCLCDEEETIIFYTYVNPQVPVTSYRFDVTGITAEHLRNAMPLKDVQEKILQILHKGEATLLVGHSLENDLACLDIKYHDYLLRDTAHYQPLMKTNIASHSLKYLAEKYLGYNIQSGFHDPYEDCVASMRLYKRFRALDHQKGGDWPLVAKMSAKDIPESFDSWETYDIEKIALNQLYDMSTPNYKCWCLDRMKAMQTQD